jgi:hypothetical protein
VKVTSSQLDEAKYESKHAFKLDMDDESGLSPIVRLLKLVMIRTFAIIEDHSAEKKYSHAMAY